MSTLRILRKMRTENIPVRLGRNVFLYSPKMKKKEEWTILVEETFLNAHKQGIEKISNNLNFKTIQLHKNNKIYFEIIDGSVQNTEIKNIELQSDIVI